MDVELMKALSEYNGKVEEMNKLTSFFKKDLKEAIDKEIFWLNKEFHKNTYEVGYVVDEKTNDKEIKIKIASLKQDSVQNELTMDFYLDFKNNCVIVQYLNNKFKIFMENELGLKEKLKTMIINYVKSCLIHNLYQD